MAGMTSQDIQAELCERFNASTYVPGRLALANTLLDIPKTMRTLYALQDGLTADFNRAAVPEVQQAEIGLVLARVLEPIEVIEERQKEIAEHVTRLLPQPGENPPTGRAADPEELARLAKPVEEAMKKYKIIGPA